MPSVSAYIIGRNCAGTLPRAIESVLGQTHPVSELWYVDDASDDDSAALARSYAAAGVKVLVNESHQGIFESRNRAVSQCTGEWVGVLDADDTWAPDKLEQQLSRIEVQPELVLVGGFAQIVDEDLEALGVITCPLSDSAIKNRELVHNCFVHSTVLFKRALFEAVGGYPR